MEMPSNSSPVRQTQDCEGSYHQFRQPPPLCQPPFIHGKFDQPPLRQTPLFHGKFDQPPLRQVPLFQPPPPLRQPMPPPGRQLRNWAVVSAVSAPAAGWVAASSSARCWRSSGGGSFSSDFFLSWVRADPTAALATVTEPATWTRAARVRLRNCRR